MGMISDVLRAVGLKKKKNLRAQGNYWDRRKNLYYYDVVKEWVEEVSPGDWIFDVGSNNTPIINTGDFKRRTMLDISPFASKYDGVEAVVADWLTYKLEGKPDLILCLQVLEHLSDDIVEDFARKLLRSGKLVIISVPYKWEPGKCKWHLQDPVDLDKLISWTGQKPLKSYIETRDKSDRLITLYEGSPGA